MITLRDVQPEDKDKLREWRNLPEVCKYMYTDHHITVEEHEKWFQIALCDPTRRYWIITLDQEDVGLVNLCDIDSRNKRCYWAYYIANPQTRGKGVGSFVEYWVLSYVFDHLRLNKLCGEVLASNQGVLHIHQGFGFIQEGYLRQHVFKGGKPVDVVSISMLREEWDARKPEIEDRLRKKGLI